MFSRSAPSPSDKRNVCERSSFGEGLKYLLIIFSVLILFSCKTKTVLNNSKPIDANASIASNKYFFDEILKKSSFEQVKINSRIDVENGSSIPTLDATIYIENGQKVWMNISALLFNIARGMATPEGIKGYEKWNKTFIDSDYAYLNNLLGVNFIDYSSLQNLLLGRTFVPINETDFVLKKNAGGYSLESIENQKVTSNGKTKEYKISLNYTTDFNLSNVFLQEINANQNLEVNYSNFNSINNLNIPQNVKIIIKGEKTSQILIENTKFDFSKMETPYSVPNNYTKTVIR